MHVIGALFGCVLQTFYGFVMVPELLLAIFLLLSMGESLHCARSARALHAHCALLLDYVPPEEPPSTPLGNALRIR